MTIAPSLEADARGAPARQVWTAAATERDPPNKKL
jgi:hypothetical protein